MPLLSSKLVHAVDAALQPVLDEIARARRWPTSSEPARLGALVRRLSDAYNQPGCAPPRNDDALAARLVFSFPRDVPKGAGAVRELVASGALALSSGRALRVLDLGAGLGATTRGVARALAASGAAGELVVDAIDTDGDALDLASAIARARPREAGVKLELLCARAVVSEARVQGPYDLIVFGQVLSELDRDQEADRVVRHASLVRAFAAHLHPDGAIVIVEPALRERTRHLHAVRDALLEGDGARLHVFAPCVHDAACPMLREPDGWCHEDLDVDLPPWLVPVARAAGLRWQGLTFSYLVLRRDQSRHCFAAAPASLAPLRVVSSPVVTKGKRELFLCGAFEGAPGAAQRKVMRLDRHAAAANQAWDAAARGDVLGLMPAPLLSRPRVDASSRVEPLSLGVAGQGPVDSPEARR